MVFAVVTDGREIDQIVETRALAQREKRDLEGMGCEVSIRSFPDEAEDARGAGLMAASLTVRVTPEGEPTFLVSLDWLLREDAGLREVEAELRAALAADGVYHGGGGAAGSFKIEATGPQRAVTLPNGRRVGLGVYVRAWKALKGYAPDDVVGGFDYFPNTAEAVLFRLRAGLTDRINTRGGLVVRESRVHPSRYGHAANPRARIDPRDARLFPPAMRKALAHRTYALEDC